MKEEPTLTDGRHWQEFPIFYAKKELAIVEKTLNDIADNQNFLQNTIIELRNENEQLQTIIRDLLYKDNIKSDEGGCY